MTSSTKFTFDLLKIAKTSEFVSFALTISSDEPQSKAHFNLQNVGENKTGYRAENKKFVLTDENFKKSPHLLTLLFYTLLIMYCYAKQYQFATN